MPARIDVPGGEPGHPHPAVDPILVAGRRLFHLHLDDPENNLSVTSWIRQSMWEGLYGVTASTEFFPELLAEEASIAEVAKGADGAAKTANDAESLTRASSQSIGSLGTAATQEGVDLYGGTPHLDPGGIIP